MRYPLILLTLFALAFATTLNAKSDLKPEFNSLQELMTYSDFKAAGLEKLSAEELESLNNWIRLNTRSQIAVSSTNCSQSSADPASSDQRGLNSDIFSGSKPEPIITRIKGPFRGWKAKPGERFELENGQIWVTTDGSSSLTIQVENPSIVIAPGMLGSWNLKVEGYNTRAKVKRIK